ncbi:hypothetical protein HMPREF1004_01954 [Ralstonia pickettii]|jgi:two-component system OmpR family sensor kinase|nr:hypothetical protein HMPREF1004_01954 [Ralstonia pickettii]
MRWSRPLGFDAPDGERRRPAHPPSRIARVFEPCLRLNASRDRHSGGFGLGLAIVRRIALVHGGDVRLDAAAAGGARFAVLLPAMTIPPL